MYPDPVEIAFFGGNVASVVLGTHQAASGNTNVVAQGYGKGVQQVFGATIGLFECRFQMNGTLLPP